MSTTSPRPDAGPEEIQADIESTRAQLAATVDALAAKFDVGAQAKSAVHDVRENVSEAAHGAAERAAGAAGKVKDTISGVAGSAAGRVENVAHAGKVKAREAAGQIAGRGGSAAGKRGSRQQRRLRLLRTRPAQSPHRPDEQRFVLGHGRRGSPGGAGPVLPASRAPGGGRCVPGGSGHRLGPRPSVSGVDTLRADTDAPDPDHPAKPDSPPKLNGTLWKYALKRSVKEFSNDQCTDMAAALTYYAVLSMFPAFVALISILGVFGNGKATVDTADGHGAAARTGRFAGHPPQHARPVDHQSWFRNRPVVGLLGAIWSASGFVGAFGRTMNRIYEVPEGRPIWKLRPQTLLITVVVLILVAIAAASLVLTGPVAKTVGDVVGLGSTAVTVWNIAKWPFLLLLVVIIIAILYFGTPNVRQPKFRWMSTGALVAILVWVVASVGFGLYVANFSNYNKTYGSLAGVIVFLLWLWLGNLALLFGAEFDSELERARQLQAGMDSEEDLQLPVRDDRKVRKAQAGLSKLVARPESSGSASADLRARPMRTGTCRTRRHRGDQDE